MRRNTDLKGIWGAIDNLISALPGNSDFWERLKEKADFASSRPERASEIIERKFESEWEGEYHILKNPRAGTYLKLTDRDFYLWNLMDGTRSVKDLVIAYFTRYNSFAFSRVGTLVTQLKKNLFLTDQPVNTFDNLKDRLDKRTFGHRADSFWRSLLSREFALHNIDRCLSRVYRAVGWILFTRPMKFLYLILSGLGVSLFIRELDRASYPILRLWRMHSYGLGFLSLLAIYFAIAAIHEVAHAFTLKSYGRDIRKGGFMIYFGMPAFFVDTMDVWMEPRGRRIAVSWAGPYSQLISGGLCSMIAFFFPETIVGSLLFKFAFFSYLSVFFNLTPLLEMDGYFILIDWLEIPFLRQKSLTFVRKSLWSKLLKREEFSRDEKIFTVFGVLAGIWSMCAIFIAVYLWERRIVSALSYLGTVGLILGIPLLLLLVIKVASVIYSAFVWIASSKFVKKNSNLIALLVSLSIVLAVISYFTSGDRYQTHKEIFRLLLLVYALLFAVKSILHYREGRLENTFRFLTLFIFLLFIADLLAAFFVSNGTVRVPYDGSSAVSFIIIIQSAIRIGAYLSLLISVSMLASRDLRLCRRSEKLTTLILLALSGTLVFTIIKWGLGSGDWQLDLVPMLNFIFPMTLVLLAFILLIPSCFIYQGTEFLIAWLVMGLSLMWVSTANLLGFYEEASTLAGSFYILGYSLFASALVSHYVIYTRVQFSRLANMPTASEVTFRYDDKRRLRSAFASIYGAISSQIASVYGQRISRYIWDRLNARSAEAGWKLKAAAGGIEDNVSAEFSIISLGEVYRGFLSQMLDLSSSIAGRAFVEKAMQRICDRLYWEEREVADEYLLSPLERGKKLTEEFRMAKADRLNVLKGMAIFSGLRQEEVSLISSCLETEKFREGMEIIRQGDVGNRLYIIKSGRVEVSVRSDADGTERIVAHLSDGDYFGEIALLGNVPRTATCRAATSAEMWVLNKRHFDQLVKRHLDLPERLDRSITTMTMLERMPLFREFTYKQINMISSRLRSRIFPTQSVIIQQGEPGDAFYIIKSGEVAVTVSSEAGEKTVARLGEGEYFGEIALVTDQPRIATVTSVSETELLIMEKRDFDAIVELISSDLEQAGSRRQLDTRRKLSSV